MKGLWIIGCFMLLISCKQKNKATTTAQKAKQDSIAQQIDNGKKKIYLTFDDGPTTGSKRLYDLLIQKQVPTTLYLVGKHYNAMPGMHKMLDSLKKMPYIVMANHSYSHAYGDQYLKFYTDVPGVIKDYTNAQQILGITSGIARCAGRNVWRTANLTITDDKGPGTAMDSLYKMGYQFTGWDCTWPYDYKTFKNTRDVAGMLNRVKVYFDSSFTKQPNHIVLLGHDQQYADDEDFKQLEDFIDSIKASKIYEFATMDKYPGIK
jgi:peptidoglycan-N-acetylglucosamine deacetylase